MIRQSSKPAGEQQPRGVAQKPKASKPCWISGTAAEEPTGDSDSSDMREGFSDPLQKEPVEVLAAVRGELSSRARCCSAAWSSGTCIESRTPRPPPSPKTDVLAAVMEATATAATRVAPPSAAVTAPRGAAATKQATRPSSADTHVEGNLEISPINWDYHNEFIPDASVAGAWDFNHLSDEVVEADFTDAATYRLIVSSLPTCSNNIKQLRAFRDNVTRKLAPTIARAMASPSPEGILLPAEKANGARPTIVRIQEMAIVDGHAASRLGPRFLVQPRRTSPPCASTVTAAPPAVPATAAAATAAAIAATMVSDLGGAPGFCQDETMKQEEPVAPHDSTPDESAAQSVSVRLDVRQNVLHHCISSGPSASISEAWLPSTPASVSVVSSSITRPEALRLSGPEAVFLSPAE
ncbi:hypothetical protein VOLCADRAFT_91040 [Volvox carteri f. nagariensis]|uniref:Uncharacterized protein n=1 Tax=Volvox carteri f. nagariensis TaxID=3068 RepID=D8TW11_VOLCA|nr:uncharacterized protein VOLCADRAFT_91040 [Volvox carteri f. nagariensis]EFJ48397.1 hypothetical protein VOLCADRAFT_91040 [Volvox carteri f. nagariensis]|eukprot:XP_002950651.1 hypothetical protein VOLCADRAFT_91040 [Volvox carteri f. nagariensis]